MPATVTLASTTLSEGIDDKATRIKLASTAGITAGLRLYIDRELVGVVRLDIDPWVIVKRGADGSPSIPHGAGTQIFIGRADQFYSSPPNGRPASSIEVSPYIDVVGGRVYFAQGDAVPAGAARYWVVQTTTLGVGPLGVRTTTLDPTSST